MALWVSNEPTELRNNASEDDLQTVIRAVYRQVLGNHHVMDNQRETEAESQLRNGDITVREFVRRVAQGGLYQSLFFDNASPYRFVELNCKHLLGRAPHNQAEISEHVQRYNADGYAAEISSYIDSDEYLTSFGENTVPFAKGAETQAGQTNVGFNRAFALMRGYASNSGKSSKLISDLGSNLATKIAAPTKTSGGYASTAKRFRISAVRTNFGPRTLRSNYSVEVNYSQLSKRIQNIQKSGGQILSITEI
ncbi:phycobilisome linker polypeptide [filamentous cyanobacterium LEGE 11480]|uniref:Phycobilisome linker polypeptide n=1 Tax=Romeriopsis navalis LEGE 11480 TaxID=2777977 RepID=A0A928VPL0_9CYAN|nr:phycobilisome linker polypeptide [Romeriopsis navalis]MBE9029739.1 phycobilisome linker polypeptide [Romeriopsis navalis LEGE 11480]